MISFTFLLSMLLVVAVLHRSLEPVFTPLQGFVANRVLHGSLSCFMSCCIVICLLSIWRMILLLCRSCWSFAHVVLLLGWHVRDIFLTHTLWSAYVLLPPDVWATLSCWTGLCGIHLVCNLRGFFCASCVYFLHSRLASPCLAEDGHFHTPAFRPGD